MKKQKIINCLFLLFLFVLANNDDVKCQTVSKKENITKANLKVNSDSSYIHISHSGTKTENIFFNVNGKFFRNQAEITKQIKGVPGKEPDYVKAWRFVINRTFHDDTLTNQVWLHNPLIFLNSVGYGYCDDRASALSFLWKLLGYSSRVWCLKGHVVPEVLVNGRYEMYDPDYEVFYTDKLNVVSGVEEISKNTLDLMVAPENKISLHTCVKAYSKETKQLYSTYTNNFSNSFYETQTEINDFNMSMPTGSKLIIPVNRVSDGNNLKHTAFLLLPSDFDGSIRIPFAIHSVKGKASLTYNDKKIELNGVSSFLNIGYNDSLKISSSEKPLIIEFYINPLSLITDDSVKVELNSGIKTGTNFTISIINHSDNKSQMIYWNGIDTVDCKCISEKYSQVKSYSVPNYETLVEKTSKYFDSCIPYTEAEKAQTLNKIKELYAYAETYDVLPLLYQFVNNESVYIFNIEKLRLSMDYLPILKLRLLEAHQKKR